MSASLLALLCLALLILAAKLCGAVAGKLGLPVVLGELLAGVLLGPTVLNVWHWPLFNPSGQVHDVLVPLFKILAEIGVVLLMFIAGMETDLRMMRRAAAPAFWAAVGGIVLPMTFGAWVSHAAGFSWPQSIFIGTILTATSVTITAQTLMDVKQLKSRAGSTILGAAVLDDILGLIVLSVVIAVAPSIGTTGVASWNGLGITLGKMVICLTILVWFGPRLTRWVFGKATRLRGAHIEIAAALVVAFTLAFQAEWLGGMAAITGAYLAGLFVAGTTSHATVTRELQPMINSFFGPLFFVSIGMDIDVWQMKGSVGFFIVLLAIALLGKVVGSGLGARVLGLGNRESLAVGIGMIPRGEVGLITASLGWAAGLVSKDVYMQVVVIVLISTLVTPGLLRFVLPSGGAPASDLTIRLQETEPAGRPLVNQLVDAS